jgi:hypothetical protein
MVNTISCPALRAFAPLREALPGLYHQSNPGRGASVTPSPLVDSDGKHHLLPGPLRLCAFARGPARTFPTESLWGKGQGEGGQTWR